MAMGNCRECGKEVSSEAKSCPHCGVARPVPTDPKAAAIGCAVMLGIGVLFYWGVCSGPSTTPGYVSSAPAPAVSGCDAAAAVAALERMRGPMVARVEDDAGWTVVTFGPDYTAWTERQTEAMVRTYADTDACATRKARNLEFRSPSGKLVARADGLRGIQMK
ncbi:MAG: zinc ribbon domain-containing protein [Gemmatimonadaceae bacterium]|nr:zinc ribbon domain-containing protein [Gemmatimonadaceae bacterium]